MIPSLLRTDSCLEEVAVALCESVNEGLIYPFSTKNIYY